MSTHDNSTDNGYGRQGGYPEPARDGHTEQHSAASAQDSSAADGSSTAHDSSQSGASSPHARYAPPSMVVNIDVVSYGRPESRTTRTARATARLTDPSGASEVVGDTENATSMPRC